VADKPTTGHLDWIADDDPLKFVVPSTAKKQTGWVKAEKAPFQFFNWAWRVIDRWLQYFEAQTDEHIFSTGNPHEVTAEQAGASRSRLLTNGAGYPLMSEIQLNVATDFTESVWESVGPTGSGADHIWEALDDIPNDVDWIKLKNVLRGEQGAVNTAVVINLWARDSGATGVSTTDGANIGDTVDRADSSGNAHSSCVTTHEVPATGRVFELRYASGFTDTDVHVFLVGYGYNY